MDSYRCSPRPSSLLDSRRFSSGGWHPLSDCRRASVYQMEVSSGGEDRLVGVRTV